jgi:hypothetical protein
MSVVYLPPKYNKNLNFSVLETTQIWCLYTLYKKIYPVNGQDYLISLIYSVRSKMPLLSDTLSPVSIFQIDNEPLETQNH